MQVLEQFYSHLSQLLTSPSSGSQAYRTYRLAGSKDSDDSREIREDIDSCDSNTIIESRVSVSLREERAVISCGTTGLCSWPAGEALASWVGGQGQARWRGSRVMELGAGAGMAGIYTIKRSVALLDTSMHHIALHCFCTAVLLHCCITALLYYWTASFLALHCCCTEALQVGPSAQ